MRDSETLNKVLGLSLKDLQLYASRCLKAYCDAKLIQHSTIDELISHLENRPERDGLVEWEREGALLALNGRGDDMPSDLVQSISSKDIEEFSFVVDSAVEVGIVDMYGASTELPVKFMEKIAWVLTRNNIELPEL